MIDQDGNYADDDPYENDPRPGRSGADWRKLCSEVEAGAERAAAATRASDAYLGAWTTSVLDYADAVRELEPNERALLASEAEPLESQARRAALLSNALRKLAAAIRGG